MQDFLLPTPTMPDFSALLQASVSLAVLNMTVLDEILCRLLIQL